MVVYQIDQNNILGKGSYGTVYTGHPIGNEDDKVAVKIIYLNKIRPAQLKSMTAEFENEIEVLKDISKRCDRLLCIRDSFRINDEIWIVTELLPSQDGWIELFDFVAGTSEYSGLNTVAKREIMLNMALAVKELHSFGIAHRDIKMENFMFKYDDFSVKLIDYGFACMASNKTTISTRKTPGTKVKSCDNKLLGTPGYIDPALFNKSNKINSFASDIYSLGSTFFIFCDSYPLIGDWEMEDGEMYGANQSNNRNDLNDEENEKEFGDIIRKMTATDPNDRPDIDEVIKMLRQ